MKTTITEKLVQLLWLLCLIFCTFIKQGCGQDFGYDEKDGPNHWGEKFEHCVGKHQSPINIEEHDVHIVHLTPIIFKNFDWTPSSAILKNNGHTVLLTLESDKKPVITGGPLIGDYQFAQLHFHWGANDAEGSENRINNNSYPLELHMVFFQSAYGSFDDSVAHPDGLAVLSFLYSPSEKNNNNYNTLLEAMVLVKDPQSATTIKDIPFIKELGDINRSVYYTYGGSLTTPPCSEVVTWIEFKNTIELTHEQIEVFRQLNSEHGKLLHNFRPVQPLHGRTIRMNTPIEDTEPAKEIAANKRNGKGTAPFTTINKAILLFALFLVLMWK